MTFDEQTQSLLVAIALGLAVIAVLFTILPIGGRRSPKEPTGPIHLDETLNALLQGQAAKIERLENAARALNATDKRQQALIEGGIRRVGLVRYDAFEDVGGRLSFSCALLDEHGTGVVLTSINGRQETRAYAKPVSGSTSSYNLSLEEEEAIRQAMASPDQTAVQA